MSILGIIAGGIIGAIGWYQTGHIKDLHLTKNNERSLYVASIVYTFLAVISLFGLIGVIMKKKGFVSAYSSMVWIHLGFNVGTGAYFLYTLFHKIGQQDLNDCQSTNDTDLTRAACKKGFEIARGILVGIYVVVWLVELWGCLIVSDYVGQLEEEEALEWPQAVTTAPPDAAAPAMATTYNYGAQYAFSANDNSYGRQGAPNNV